MNTRRRTRRARKLKADDLRDMCHRAREHREARNGFTEAMWIVHFTLPKIFVKERGPTYEEVRMRVVDELFTPMVNDADFTEEALETFMKETFEQGAMIDVTEEVVAYCALAAKAFLEGNETMSWSYACDAQYWAGVVMVSARRADMPGPATLLAKMKAAKQAKEYTAIEDYWCANIDRKLSAQKAANKILIAGVTAFGHKKIAEIVSALRRGETFR